MTQTTPDDLTGLAERLRKAADRLGYDVENGNDALGLKQHDMNAVDTAATLIERQAEMLEEAREALLSVPDDIGLYRIIRDVRPRSNATIAKAIARALEPANKMWAKLNASGTTPEEPGNG